MARRSSRFKDVIKVTIDPDEIGHDKIMANLVRFLEAGHSKSGAARRMMHMFSLILEGTMTIDDLHREMAQIDEGFKAHLRDFASRQRREHRPSAPPTRPSVAVSSEAPKIAKVESAPAASSAPANREAAVEPVKSEGSQAVHAPQEASDAPRPRTGGMLKGLKGMMATVDASPSLSKPAPEQPARPASAQEAAPRATEKGGVLSPAAMAGAVAAKMKANGREL